MGDPDNRGAATLRRMFPGRGQQTRLAEEIGTYQGNVSKWWNGLKKPSTRMRLLLQDRYGIGWQLWDKPIVRPRLALRQPEQRRRAS